MSVLHYVALIDGSPQAFGVVFPDLPGCTSGGWDFDEATSNAVEAVRLWIEDARADGEDIPAPRSMEQLCAEPGTAAALAAGAAYELIAAMQQNPA